MNRLPFRLPEWAPRVIWSSAHAREVWQPRIAAVSQAWIVAERASVAAGIRPSALQHCTPEDLPRLMRAQAEHGLMVLPLAQVAKVQGYQSGTTALAPGAPFDYRVAITQPEHAAAWAAAPDDDAIGRLLGTPDCCRQFFERVWKHERWMDTTVPMTEKQPQISDNGLNMLWRWLGVRPVSHLPCAHDCAESLALSEHLATLLPEPERTWHLEILSWPALYTSLFGIAEITSPIHRMSVPTDALAERVEVRYLGTGYPVEGASGLAFPFRQSAPVVAPLRFVRTMQHPSDNGFSSRAGQHAAHARLLEALGSRTWRTVVDLGAGNGALLGKVPATIRIAVESDPTRAARIPEGVTVRIADCTQPGILAGLYAKLGSDDLVIAQRTRNPPTFFTARAFWLLSYSYESGAPAPQLFPPQSP